MKMFNSVGEFFALDIGTTAVRIVQLSGGGDSWRLAKYASVPVDIKIATSDAPEDQRRLAEVITTAIGQSGVRTRDVVLGIPSNRMFATIVELPDMPSAELASTIKYQAEQYIPMSLDEAKIDWAVVGPSPKDDTKKEILLASVSNTFSEQRLDLVESLGLNVLAMEPDSLAICRSLLPKGVSGSNLIVEVSDFSSDIVMAMGDTPRLIRSVPTGFRSLVKATVQNLNVEEQQAEQFISKFGVDPTKLEGQVARALDTTIDQFSSEVVKSIKFYQTKYPSTTITTAMLSGYAGTIPGLGDYLSKKINLPVQAATPWQRVVVAETDQAALQPISSHFAVAVGLAERMEI